MRHIDLYLYAVSFLHAFVIRPAAPVALPWLRSFLGQRCTVVWTFCQTAKCHVMVKLSNNNLPQALRSG